MSRKELPEEKLARQLWAVSKSWGMNPPMPPHMQNADIDEDNPFKGAVIGIAIGMVIWFGALGVAYLWWG